jgi:hypothetical protein
MLNACSVAEDEQQLQQQKIAAPSGFLSPNLPSCCAMQKILSGSG